MNNNYTVIKANKSHIIPLQKFVKKEDMYRSYSYKLIQVPQVIYYDTEGMQK